MTENRRTLAILAISLLAALAMIAASAIFEAGDTVTFLIVAIWWVPFSFLVVRRKPPGGA